MILDTRWSPCGQTHIKKYAWSQCCHTCKAVSRRSLISFWAAASETRAKLASTCRPASWLLCLALQMRDSMAAITPLCMISVLAIVLCCPSRPAPAHYIYIHFIYIIKNKACMYFFEIKVIYILGNYRLYQWYCHINYFDTMSDLKSSSSWVWSLKLLEATEAATWWCDVIGHHCCHCKHLVWCTAELVVAYKLIVASTFEQMLTPVIRLDVTCTSGCIVCLVHMRHDAASHALHIQILRADAGCAIW